MGWMRRLLQRRRKVLIVVGLPCNYCNGPTVQHCGNIRCGWSRCPRCHSYGMPGKNFIRWIKADYINPYTLLDLVVAEPQRTFPTWLEEDYGTRRDDA